jgi:hypothetical protein
MIVFSPLRLTGTDTDDTFDGDLSGSTSASSDDGLNFKAKGFGFKSSGHSESFLLHLESVRSSWPRSGGGYIDHDASDKSHQEHEMYDIGCLNDGGVPCEGEPSIDPSRMMQGVFDGESYWI